MNSQCVIASRECCLNFVVTMSNSQFQMNFLWILNILSASIDQSKRHRFRDLLSSLADRKHYFRGGEGEQLEFLKIHEFLFQSRTENFSKVPHLQEELLKLSKLMTFFGKKCRFFSILFSLGGHSPSPKIRHQFSYSKETSKIPS